jgi:hypothetical protein
MIVWFFISLNVSKIEKRLESEQSVLANARDRHRLITSNIYLFNKHFQSHNDK